MPVFRWQIAANCWILHSQGRVLAVLRQLGEAWNGNQHLWNKQIKFNYF
jgi:hypothetical protein